MDSNRIPSADVIKDGIGKGMYEITGILKTGEIVIALLSDVEKEYLSRVLINSTKSKKYKLNCVKALINTRGRPAKELLQVYKQYTCKNYQKSSKNGLRFR